ncbi:hypothetical protein H5410_064368 [Solanum commersonii]|uniref:DUF4283 domain-containing protein n=1 Tax=Solanum commersonii TaxID=4109 RepID=A0A9J5VZL3_SOLCO|nr:hypothetical protein H5410_064368 [Solanum commersonii]
MDGGIVVGENFGEYRTYVAGIYEKSRKGNLSPLVDIHLSKISSKLDGGNTNNNQSIQQDTTTHDRPTEEPGHDYQQSKEQTGSRQQTKGKVVLSAKESQNEQHEDINQPGGTTRLQQGSDIANLAYQNNFPQIYNNYTRQGLPAVLLEEDDYNIKLDESCKHTLVGKFTNTMPKIEIIRKSFTLQTQLTGGVKITHYNSRHVYIDLDNEFDYVTKTRGSMARVKLQIDLTKERPPHVWVGFKNSDPNKGRWQKIQYEGIPDYCMYCKHQGHMENACTIKRRDEDFKKRKEMETEKRSKNKGDQEKGGTKIIQVHDSDISGETTSSQHQQLLGKKKGDSYTKSIWEEIPEQKD